MDFQVWLHMFGEDEHPHEGTCHSLFSSFWSLPRYPFIILSHTQSDQWPADIAVSFWGFRDSIGTVRDGRHGPCDSGEALPLAAASIPRNSKHQWCAKGGLCWVSWHHIWVEYGGTWVPCNSQNVMVVKIGYPMVQCTPILIIDG